MRRRLASAVVAVLVLSLMAVAPAGAVHDTGSEFRVFLHTDGSAEVVLYEKYNLSNATERATYERLKSNATAREERLEAFRERLKRGARIGENLTGRPMSIENVSIGLTRPDNGTAALRLRATWTGLAAVEQRRGADDYVEVTAPFGRGFEVNRTLAVYGPDGFTRAVTDPLPGRALKNSAFWGVDKNLSGFTARFVGDVPGTPVPTAEGGDEPAATPRPPQGTGVFLGAVMLALVPTFVVALALRRLD